jgi:hypothetical protein
MRRALAAPPKIPSKLQAVDPNERLRKIPATTPAARNDTKPMEGLEEVSKGEVATGASLFFVLHLLSQNCIFEMLTLYISLISKLRLCDCFTYHVMLCAAEAPQWNLSSFRQSRFRSERSMAYASSTIVELY